MERASKGYGNTGVRKLMCRVVCVCERCDNPTVGVHESKKVFPVEGIPEDMLLLVGMSFEVFAPVVRWCVAINKRRVSKGERRIEYV